MLRSNERMILGVDCGSKAIHRFRLSVWLHGASVRGWKFLIGHAHWINTCQSAA